MFGTDARKRAFRYQQGVVDRLLGDFDKMARSTRLELRIRKKTAGHDEIARAELAIEN